MNVFLIDGTYELFRHFYAVPSTTDVDGREVGAVRGVVGSVLRMLEDDVTHIGVATDHVLESFRNELWPGYKTGEGIDPTLFAQFHPLEEALEALGVMVWPMTDLEADDGLASAAEKASRDSRVEQVFICTPDKDLAQCVRGRRVVQFDRRAGVLRDHDAVLAKFGVPPGSIPDYLSLVGDTADGFPGLPGWGAKSASRVLDRYTHIEDIPPEASLWEVDGLRGAAKLSKTLQDNMELALLFRIIATVDRDAPVGTVDEWEWRGPTDEFPAMCERIGVPALATRAAALAP